MTIQNDKIDEFYKNYVNDICMKVEEKAELEFEYIWNEHKKTGIDNCVISDKLFILIKDFLPI
jgi:glutamate dehydrogenase